MVCLTMTSAMVEAIETVKRHGLRDEISTDELSSPFANPAVGDPIEHEQVLAISKILRSHTDITQAEPNTYDLDFLLRGSKIFKEPPKPKAEPTSSYKALMQRLRQDEEARAYQNMLGIPHQLDSRVSGAANTTPFGPSQSDVAYEDDEITYADFNRQMALIINIIVSIVACSVALWMAASHWSTPKRLGLSMGGSGMVGVGEVIVYAAYLRRLQKAREKGKKGVEVKEIVKTWVIESEGSPENSEKPIRPISDMPGNETSRRRLGKHET